MIFKPCKLLHDFGIMECVTHFFVVVHKCEKSHLKEYAYLRTTKKENKYFTLLPKKIESTKQKAQDINTPTIIYKKKRVKETDSERVRKVS